MPTPDNLDSIEVTFEGGYFPSAAALAPRALQRTIRRGANVWLRPGGKIEVANGLLQTSATNVGARLFASDTQRASIAGSLVSSRLPYAGLLRYQNAVLLYLSQDTSAQVYLDETAVTGLTTSSTAGRLRVAVPDGSGGYNVFDAGFDKPLLVQADVTTAANNGAKNMQGFIGAALCRWRTKTNAWSPPSEVIYNNITANTNTTLDITLQSPASGQDGWLFLGTQWGDRSGRVRIVRYIYITPRGTFSATNGSPNISGTNTRWTQDLQVSDVVTIDGTDYQIQTITDDDSVVLTANFTGSTGSGKTMTMNKIRPEWFDGELRDIIDRDIQRPLRAAGITQFAGRVILWGIPDTNNTTSSSATGNGFAVMLDNNPEHIGTLGRVTASGSDLVNALAGDGPLYLMTTTSLEIIERVSTGDQPFVPRIIAEPGFKAGTNGCLYKDWFYGFNNRPLRTRARENIDVQFAAPVWEDMEGWDATRVIVAVDPDSESVLYIYDNATTTTVRPWLAQQGVWNPPINLSARIMDAQVVNGKLYVTYLSGGNIRVNEWEGGTGLSDAYVASQYYDARQLARNRLKNVSVAGKVASVNVFAAVPGSAVPDVSNTGVAAVTFTKSDTAEMLEAENRTNVLGSAFAFRANLSTDGTVQKIVGRGTPISELK